MKLRTFFSAVLLLFCSAVPAQNFPKPSFTQLDAENIGVTKAINQVWDSEGKLWTVTDKGLLCYDGYKARIIGATKTPGNAPLNNEIRSLIKTGPDEFWLTYTDDYSLTLFNPIGQKFRHYFSDTLKPGSVSRAELAKIIKENDSLYWLLTWGDGINQINIETGKVERVAGYNGADNSNGLPCRFVKDMIKTGENEFLVAFFEEGKAIPHFFNSKTNVFTPFPLDEYIAHLDEQLQRITRMGFSIINFIHPDDSGNFWIGTYIGLFIVDNAAKKISRIAPAGSDFYRQNLANTRNYIIDDQGFMWVGTQNQGIMLVNLKTREVRFIQQMVDISTSLSDDRIMTMAVDPLGSIWVSTEAGIFSICNPRAQKFAIHPWKDMGLDFTHRSYQTIPVNQLVIQPDGNFLISNQTGIVQYDPVEEEVLRVIDPDKFASLPSYAETRVESFRLVGSQVHFIVKMPRGRDEIGAVIDLEKGTAKAITSAINPHHILFRHSDSTHPIVYFSNFTNDLLLYDAASNSLSSIKEFPDSIWLKEYYSFRLKSGKWLSASFPAFLIFDPETGDYDQYSHRAGAEHSFPDSVTTCGFLDRDGLVWIGTKNGLYTFDENTGKSEKQNHALGLGEQESINCIIQDNNGIFWIALKKDLLRWDRQTGDVFRYDRSHGLRCGSFIQAVAQKDRTGRIYIATYTGVLSFDPSTLDIPENTLQIYLSDAFLLDSVYGAAKILRGENHFSHDENFLTFEFYTNQIATLTAHRFYYKLSGRDETWQDNGISNRIRLADLSHGSYTLEVKAVNTFGHESNILTIPFVIEKPFWLRWWFFAAIAAVLILIVFYYIKRRERTLRKRSIELERTVTDRTADVVREKREAEKQRLEAEHQKEIVEEKQKEITDSINYAKRLQDAYLPEQQSISAYFKKSFIFFRPKDIVSGDFYWFNRAGMTGHESDDEIFIAAADCTGHGVPGAIMSFICCGALNEVIINKGVTNPGKVLDAVREIIIQNLKSSTSSQQKDGMDIALCKVNTKTGKVEFAGAHNPLWVFRKATGEMDEVKADKQPVGMFDHRTPFINHEIQLQPGDSIYLFSDGFADQFGGPKGKKFKSSSLRSLLLQNAGDPMETQKTKLVTAFEQWKGDLEQLDDVCVIGVGV